MDYSLQTEMICQHFVYTTHLLLELLVLGGAGGGCVGRCELARVPLRLGV